MVRNVTGGNKAKGKSRKGRERGGGEVKGVDPDDVRLFRGKVVRGAGDFRVEVDIPTLGDKFICRIPGKFRRRVYFNPEDHVLVVSSERIDRISRGDILEVVGHLSRPKEAKEGGEGYEFSDAEDQADEKPVGEKPVRDLPPSESESE